MINTVRESETNIRITYEKIENEKKVISEYSKDINQGEKDLKELMDLLSTSRSKLENFDTDLEKSEHILEDSKKNIPTFNNSTIKSGTRCMSLK